jgi:hypothetical protein
MTRMRDGAQVQLANISTKAEDRAWLKLTGNRAEEWEAKARSALRYLAFIELTTIKLFLYVLPARVAIRSKPPQY